MAHDPGKELQSPPPRPGQRLSKPVRATSGVLGLLMVAFAGVVLWNGADGAATTAFIVAATIFLLLAVTGMMPVRMKSGSHEVEWGQLKEGVVDTVDTLTSEMTQSQIADSARNATEELSEEFSPADGIVVARLAQHQRFEVNCKTLMLELASDMNLEAKPEARLVRKIKEGDGNETVFHPFVDLLLIAESGKQIIVEYSLKLDRHHFIRTLSRTQWTGDDLLILTSNPKDFSTTNPALPNRRVIVAGPDKQAVRDALLYFMNKNPAPGSTGEFQLFGDL